MNLYLKQHIFTWGDKFTVYDGNGNDIYYVEGEVFTWGKKLHVKDTYGREIAFIQQKLFSFLPKYYITVNGNQVAEVVKEFTFFKQEYSVNGLGWKVTGDFLAHDYSILSSGGTVATVSKRWFTWGDTYEIIIPSQADEQNVLEVVLIIDACIEAQQNNN